MIPAALMWGAAAAPWVIKGAQALPKIPKIGGVFSALSGAGALNTAGRAVGALGPRTSFIKHGGGVGSYTSPHWQSVRTTRFGEAPWSSIGTAFREAPFRTTGRLAGNITGYGAAPYMVGKEIVGRSGEPSVLNTGQLPGAMGSFNQKYAPEPPQPQYVDPTEEMMQRMAAMRTAMGIPSDFGPSPVAPDFFDVMQRPEIKSFVDQQVAAMQSPYRAQIGKRKKQGKQQLASIENIGEESARIGKNLRMEQKGARESYQKEAAKRQEDAADALGTLADRMLGMTQTEGSISELRAKQQQESAERAKGAIESEVGYADTGMYDIESAMREGEAIERMRDAEELRLAREQMQSDVTDLESQVAAIAGQSPELARQFASDLYQNELAKYKEESDIYQAKIKSADDLNMEIAKRELDKMYGTGDEPTFEDFFAGYLSDERPITTLKGETKEGGVSQEVPLRLSQMLTPEEVSYIEQAYRQGGSGAAMQVIAALTAEVRERVPEYNKEIYGYKE